MFFSILDSTEGQDTDVQYNVINEIGERKDRAELERKYGRKDSLASPKNDNANDGGVVSEMITRHPHLAPVVAEMASQQLHEGTMMTHIAASSDVHDVRLESAADVEDVVASQSYLADINGLPHLRLQTEAETDSDEDIDVISEAGLAVASGIDTAIKQEPVEGLEMGTRTIKHLRIPRCHGLSQEDLFGSQESSTQNGPNETARRRSVLKSVGLCDCCIFRKNRNRDYYYDTPAHTPERDINLNEAANAHESDKENENINLGQANAHYSDQDEYLFNTQDLAARPSQIMSLPQASAISPHRLEISPTPPTSPYPTEPPEVLAVGTDLDTSNDRDARAQWSEDEVVCETQMGMDNSDGDYADDVFDSTIVGPRAFVARQLVTGRQTSQNTNTR